MPSATPSSPPSADSASDSVRNWARMWAGLAPTAMRTPISRVRSVTLTSMMFMMPMPPTSSDTAAIPASSMVMRLGAVVLGRRGLGEVADREVVGARPAPGRWRSRSSSVIWRWARAVASAERGADVQRPGDVGGQAALDAGLEGLDRDEHAVVEVLPGGRLALARQHADDGERDAADAHRAADRIGAGAEQVVDHGLAQHRHLGRRSPRRRRSAGCPGGPTTGGCRSSRAWCPCTWVFQFCSSLTTWALLRSGRGVAHAGDLALDGAQVVPGQRGAPTRAAAHAARAGRRRAARSAGSCPARRTPARPGPGRPRPSPPWRSPRRRR